MMRYICGLLLFVYSTALAACSSEPTNVNDRAALVCNTVGVFEALPQGYSYVDASNHIDGGSALKIRHESDGQWLALMCLWQVGDKDALSMVNQLTQQGAHSDGLKGTVQQTLSTGTMQVANHSMPYSVVAVSGDNGTKFEAMVGIATDRAKSKTIMFMGTQDNGHYNLTTTETYLKTVKSI
jgi:hypothetical protein